MENEIFTRRGEDTPRIPVGREYLWFALLLLVVLVGAAGH